MTNTIRDTLGAGVAGGWVVTDVGWGLGLTVTDTCGRGVVVVVLGGNAVTIGAVVVGPITSGVLGPEDFATWALPYAARALERAKGAPRIYYSRDSALFLDQLAQTGADVFSLDWRVDLAKARDVLGPAPIQGNLDPTLLLGPPDRMLSAANDVVGRVGDRPGHIFNLGHGVLPETSLENVQALARHVHEVSRRQQ